MKVIKMMIGGHHIATISDHGMETFIKPHMYAPNLDEWYGACFYSIPHSDTFEQRYDLVVQNNYFCYLKPSLKLVAEDVDSEE